VASRTTALQSHFGEDELRLVEPGNPAALADALVALAGDGEARARLARAGREAFERYAPERQRERYVELFTRLLGGQGARGGLAAVVWAPSERRTELLAHRLGATLHRVHYLSYKRPLVAPLKYPLQALRTWQLLAAQRPAAVLVTNPPVVAVLCVAFYGALAKTPYVMDTHPPALFSRKWGWTLPLQRRLARRALVNVTDQDRFAQLIASWGTRCVVVPNPPVVVERPAPDPDARFTVAVVNTFAEDEPLEPILEAARRLPAIRFAVTGDPARARRGVLARAPANVAFTGYLHGSDYWALLGGARAVVALTTFAHSVLGAAQDGVAMGRPLVLSDQPALRATFSRGAVFTPNSADGLVAAIAQLRERERELRAEVAALRAEHRRGFDERFAQLGALLASAVR
jgi:glycosyltransferase involved in cell wall biosynthesis